MNIALCYQNVLPARGGCETYIVDLTRRLVEDDHEVHLYASQWDKNALPGQVRFHHVRMPSCPRFRRPWLFGANCARALRQSFHHVSIGFDKTWGQDILYPQGGLHVATVEHNYRIHKGILAQWVARLQRWSDPAYWSFSLLERRQYLGPKPPVVIVNSQMVARHFQHHYGVDPGRLRIVPNAIDPKRFRSVDRRQLRTRRRAAWGIRADESVGLFAAMNYPLKGLEPLLQAVRLLPRDVSFRLLVAGNPQFTRYDRLARKLGIAERIQFLGYCKDMEQCYFAADFLVHPTFYDPCSLVVLEALACGLPVITTRNNGASELLHPPHEGYVIDDPHDARSLAAAMQRLLQPPVRAACATVAHRTASRWTFEEHYRDMMKIFAETASHKCAA